MSRVCWLNHVEFKARELLFKFSLGRLCMMHVHAAVFVLQDVSRTAESTSLANARCLLVLWHLL